MKLYDFHIHSTFSDGSTTPTELVKEAKKHNVVALALTDHNVDDGLSEFKNACKTNKIFSIPYGVEIYAELPQDVVEKGRNDAPDVVLLGKNPNPEHLKTYQEILLKDRKDRWFLDTLDKIKQLGFYIPKFRINEQFKYLGCPPILHDFLHEKNNIKILIDLVKKDIKILEEDVKKCPINFLNKYVYAPGAPAFSTRIKGFDLTNALELASSMNCLLFIAHPISIYKSENTKTIDYYLRKGVKGIEVRSYFNTPELNQKFDLYSIKNNLIRSGGSDYHGEDSLFKIGMYDKLENRVTKEIFEELWENLPK